MTQPCPRQRGAAMEAQRQHESRWMEDGTCSYCGSLHPDETFRRLEAGEKLTPTDKNYKIYVGPDHKKFYFWHFDSEQESRLIDLANAQRINFAHPGYFYVLPYFCAPVHKEDGN